jgi:hypothetical protein
VEVKVSVPPNSKWTIELDRYLGIKPQVVRYEGGNCALKWWLGLRVQLEVVMSEEQMRLVKGSIDNSEWLNVQNMQVKG